VYDRYHLQPGDHIVGPAIVEERESTTILAPGDALTVDALGNLRISVGGRA
jgi:5-oxoprolinase (ATP-hydrolysing)/N-methylhydantoinase A